MSSKGAKHWLNKGLSLYKLGKHKEAIECFDRALKCYNEILKIDPNNAAAWNGKGLSLYKLGKHKEAIECFDRALKINPNYAAAWYNKGLSLYKLGKHKEAIECFDRALKINPNFTDAEDELKYTVELILEEFKKKYEECKSYGIDVPEARKPIELFEKGKYVECAKECERVSKILNDAVNDIVKDTIFKSKKKKEQIQIVSDRDFPIKIKVNNPLIVGWKSYKTLVIKVFSDTDVKGLTLDLSDLARYFEVIRDEKPVTTIRFPHLRKGMTVEKVKIIPKYKGKGPFKVDLIFQWKNLKKIVPIKISVKSYVDSLIPIEYEKIGFLGEGLTSYVWKCKRKKDNVLVAVKIPKEGHKKLFLKELSNWRKLKHLNVVELYSFGSSPPYAEMELCDCSLSEVKLDSLELATALVKVLDYAHSENVVHGDLKPSNILLKDGIIKVCDWGTGYTPAYAPPEVLRGGVPDKRADIWSFGVVMYEHITGVNPFRRAYSKKTYKEIELNFSKLGPLGDIIEKCLKENLDDRYKSFSEIKKDLADISVYVYDSKLSVSCGKERLNNYINLMNSYELAGDLKTVKERINSEIDAIKDNNSRKILEIMICINDIRKTCWEAICEKKSVKSRDLWVKFNNMLDYFDDKMLRIFEKDKYIDQKIKYLGMSSDNILPSDELKEICNSLCERIMHLLRKYLLDN